MRIAFAILLVSVAALASACSTAPLAPPSVNVTGNWVGTWQYENVQQGSGDIRGNFKQDGSTLSGNFDVAGPVLNRAPIVSGAVSGNEIILSYPSTGRLTVNGNTMTGTINGLNPAKVTLTKQ